MRSIDFLNMDDDSIAQIVRNRWSNFSMNEILNPLFDDNPAKEMWDEMPLYVQRNLAITMDYVQKIRSKYGYPLRLNSTWRLSDRKGRAHREGHAVDFQPSTGNDILWGKAIMDMADSLSKMARLNSLRTIRLFWEWSGEGSMGWIHIDTNYPEDTYTNGVVVRMIGYPVHGRMVYNTYEDIPPWEYVR